MLDGDSLDERLLHSVKLWRSGYAPKVILSAPLAKWQTYEDYPSWRHAMKLKMFPEDTLSVAAHKADSTREEAQYFLRYVRQQGFKKVIIVTSNYHTWRTKRVYEMEWRDEMEWRAPSFIPMSGGSAVQTAGHFSMSSVK